jgi:hypothetical protein
MADFGSEVGAGFTIIAAILGVIGLLAVLYYFKSSLGGFFTNLSAYTGETSFVQSLVNILGSFFVMIPDVLVAGGAMAGLATMELKYVIPSIVAMLASFATRLFVWVLAKAGAGQFMAGQTPSAGTGIFNLFAKPAQETVPSAQLPVGLFKGGAMSGGDRIATNMCSPQLLPGIAGSSVLNLPLGQVVIASIATIYVLDLVLNTGAGKVPAIVIGVLPVMYYFGTWLYGCGYSLTGHLMMIVLGAGLGGITFAVLDKFYSQYLPVSTPVSPNNPLQQNTPNAQCSAGGGVGGTEEEYTCDLYMNGQRVTSAVVPT